MEGRWWVGFLGGGEDGDGGGDWRGRRKEEGGGEEGEGEGLRAVVGVGLAGGIRVSGCTG